LKSSHAANADTRLASRHVLIALTMVLVLTGAIYWPGLSGDLVLDDALTLEPIARLAGGELSWHEAIFQHQSFRPLSMASFIVNWQTTGDRVWPLKLTNLFIHLLCGVLVFLLSDRLLARPVACVDRRRRWVALWITACWLLAPLLVSTVLYVTQRMAELATLFSLAALFAYVCGRERLADDRVRGLALMAAGLAVFWPLATLSKENGILVPVLIVVIEIFFFRDAQPREATRLAHGVLGLAIAATALIGIVIVISSPNPIFSSYGYRPFTLWERVLTECRILFDYLANLLLLPGASPFGVYHDDYPPSRGLLEPASTLLAAGAWLAVLVAGWFTRGTRIGLLAFGLWFYLAAHLVESTILPLELYFEHRNYLPSVGVFFSLGYGGYLLLSRARLKHVLVAMVVALPALYGVVTYHRVLVWQSWERMLFAALSHYPDSTRVHTGLANLYVSRGKLEQALKHLERAAARPGVAELGLALHAISAHCVVNRPPPPSAYQRLEQSRPGDDSYTTNALAWLTDAVARGGCRVLDLTRLAGALHHALEKVNGAGSHGNNWLLHTRTARLLGAAGSKRDALYHLDLASRLAPGRLEPGLLAIRYRLDLGDTDDARKTLLELEKQDTGRIASHSRLIEEYARQLDGADEQKQAVQ
jgi:tetratricopeptide (TPR) repeat protein